MFNYCHGRFPYISQFVYHPFRTHQDCTSAHRRVPDYIIVRYHNETSRNFPPIFLLVLQRISLDVNISALPYCTEDHRNSPVHPFRLARTRNLIRERARSNASGTVEHALDVPPLHRRHLPQEVQQHATRLVRPPHPHPLLEPRPLADHVVPVDHHQRTGRGVRVERGAPLVRGDAAALGPRVLVVVVDADFPVFRLHLRLDVTAVVLRLRTLRLLDEPDLHLYAHAGDRDGLRGDAAGLRCDGPRIRNDVA
mmetsp:Transcript_27798/g.55653  ORF Transcript_27798/g.55653 Transcript_27798/m.55653 type:complete len:252 (+) Transcript_27798:769-1524(+)